MRRFSYQIKLVSDAEPGTGMGGENVNSLAPRDAKQRLKISGSHLKGLMREQFTEISQSLGWDPSWCKALYGEADSQSDVDAVLRFGDSVAGSVKTRTISRTAVGDTQTKVDGSLRTTEAVPAGTLYQGTIDCDTDEPALIAALELSLLSVSAVGGSRSRGVGACVVTTDNKQSDFERLIGTIDAVAKSPRAASAEQTSTDPSSQADFDWGHDANQIVCLQMTFRATDPVCCPEVADKTNTIRTGFAIPASAVQGVILHRLRRRVRALAEATFCHDGFLAWPLLPIGDETTADDSYEPVRVGLTHRGAKFALKDYFAADHFQDEAIEAFDWTKVPDGAPLKAFDGVLLQSREGVKLWKASQMPHVITAHGVRNDQSEPETDDPTASESNVFRSGRNLFTVDSMAPLVWVGKVFLPAAAATALLESLAQDSRVTFGKGRSVRGHGNLSAQRIETIDWRPATAPSGHDILVAQSPLLVPEEARHQSAEQAIEQIVGAWIQTHGFTDLEIVGTWGTNSLRFGWNRTTRSETKSGGFESARLVIDPGATIKLSRRLSDEELPTLARGIGGGRQQGYGAVSLHPGKATSLYPSKPTVATQGSGTDVRLAIEKAIQIARGSMPSSSQWSALRSELTHGKDRAMGYLNRQLNERTSRIHAAWEEAAPATREILELAPNAALAALTFLSHKAADRRTEEI